MRLYELHEITKTPACCVPAAQKTRSALAPFLPQIRLHMIFFFQHARKLIPLPTVTNPKTVSQVSSNPAGPTP
jgi:hypothetical protein